jgi:hypothetical protein
MAKTPPIPAQQQSAQQQNAGRPAGSTDDNLQNGQPGNADVNLKQQGQQGNTNQNTHHQGYQQDR